MKLYRLHHVFPQITHLVTGKMATFLPLSFSHVLTVLFVKHHTTCSLAISISDNRRRLQIRWQQP